MAVSARRKKISNETIVAFYPIVRSVARKELHRPTGIQRLVDEFDMNENSARDFIDNFGKMVKGKEYQRLNTLFQTEFYLRMIEQDFGPESLRRAVSAVRQHLSAVFDTYRTTFTAGAKEAITLRMEGIHLNHLLRLIGDRPVTEVTAGVVQQFVDARGGELYLGRAVKPKTVRKAVATLRFVMNWAARQGHTRTKFPEVELVFPREKQAEPFRTLDQIATIIERGGLDAKRIRELWDGLFLDPAQVAEVLEVVRRKTNATWLYPFLVAAAHTGARRGELFRARVEDFDFDSKLVLLRELKRSRAKETFRTVDMTPLVEKVVRDYFQTVHPSGVLAFCSSVNQCRSR